MAIAFSSASVNSAGTVVSAVFTGDTAPLLPATGVLGFTVARTTPNALTSFLFSSVTAAASTITLNLAAGNKIYSGDTITIAYSTSAPSNGNVTDSAGTPLVLATFTAQAVTNSSTAVRPVVASATTDTTGLIITVNMTNATAPTLPASGVTGFAFKSGYPSVGVQPTIVSATAASSAITLTLSNAITSDAQVYLAYTPGNVTDSASPPNVMAANASIAVTNASTYTLSQLIVAALVHDGHYTADEAQRILQPYNF